MSWRDYQEQVANFYRNLGMTAEVDAHVEGARGHHDIDVLVTTSIAGMKVVWIVECKEWSRPIPKERVLVLEGVVRDVGADRGILVAAAGFQSGAHRAAVNNNITLTSLEDLQEETESERAQLVMLGLSRRVAQISSRVRELWRWPKPLVPDGPFTVGQLLKPGGTSTELTSLVLPRLVDGTFPQIIHVRGSSVVVDSFAAAARELESTMVRAEMQLSELEGDVREHRGHVQRVVQEFESYSDDLFRVGIAFELSFESDFVVAMRGLDASASVLLRRVDSVGAKDLRAIMRHFIDTVYFMPSRRASEDEWLQRKEEMGALFTRLRRTLGD